MDFLAKVIQKFPIESGTSRSGNPWSKQSWLVQTFDQYPRTVKVDAMGRAIENVNMEEGKTYRLSIDVESREFNGRWYTDVKVFRAVEEAEPNYSNGPSAQSQQAFGGAPAGQAFGAPATPPFGPATGMPEPPTAPADFGNNGDDLPF